ncbi:MAG TPA: hypothetical protein VND66_08410 [Acidobacteriaceae bacterium]|nr:hypothetical protein [Acidobacteriaceae bacterium]
MKCACVLFVCLLLPWIATAQNAPTVRQAESACGSLHVNFHVDRSGSQHPLATPIAGKAQVYIIEDWIPPGISNLFNISPTIRVGLDGKWMGADQENSYLFFAVESGEHHLCVSTQSKVHQPHDVALYGFNAKPDQRYFFRVRMPRIGNTTALLLDPLNIDEAQLLLARYPHASSTVKK